MNAHYDDWYKKIKPEHDRDREIVVGSKDANPVKLYANDWQGDYCDNQKGLLNATGKGYWNVKIAQDGQYEIELRRWPEESGKKLTEPFDATQSMENSTRPIAKAELKIQDFSQSIETKPEDKVARFVVQLKAGKTKLATNLLDKEGKLLTSAMYVKVKRIN